MAQPANLKKLARERMERTGESYTTARKNILTDKPEGPKAVRAAAARNYAKEARDARAAEKTGKKPKPAPAPAPAPSPAEELPEYPAPTDVVQYDAGLWHRVLTQAGVTNPATGEPMSEALLAGLAGGIGFMVFTFEYEEVTTATIVTRAHPEPYTQNLLTRSGAKVNERTTGSAERAAEYLDHALDAGRAVVVRVAVGALPWIESSEVDEAETIDLAIVGEHEDDLLVDDGSGSLMPISPSDLAAARAKRKKEKHWQAWIPSRRSPKLETLTANVLEAITETNGRLLGTAELKGIPVHFANRFGIAGMHTWAERLRDTSTKKGWTQIFADPQRLSAGLAQLHGFMTDTRFGGFGGLRGLYADFLDECAELPGLEPLAEHAADYAQLSADWIDLSEMIDPDVDPEVRSELFGRMADQMERIAQAEERAATALAGTLATLNPAG
ncbi:hypothetical protein CQ017_06755 [Arthrobacter sp. MYb224]|uniref:DUF4872 domain-containing protein n=1 Tax=Arthrobacter sp. MYb224 TaxID=1848600 RepID=UPI000CFD4A71|nr:DUF4872 domain-containing protein [Arthrobacter sp. MYb224]PQZ99371.1 hypothetical protein CQ017_06755 [Arthrobacter sp. MYb224]